MQKGDFLRKLQEKYPEILQAAMDTKLYGKHVPLYDIGWYFKLVHFIDYDHSVRKTATLEGRPYEDILLYIEENEHMISFWLL